MYVALFVCVIILSILVVPFIFTADLKGDILSGIGTVKVKIFFLTVFNAKWEVERVSAVQKNIIITSGKKRAEIHLNTDKKDSESVMLLFRSFPIASYMVWCHLSVSASVGFAKNAFVTTMTVGTLRIFMESFGAFLKSRQKMSVCKSIEPVYFHDELSFSIYGIIKLSPANIINSVIAGWKNKLGVRGGHNGKIAERQKAVA